MVKIPIDCIIKTPSACRQICRRVSLRTLQNMLGLRGWRATIASGEIAWRVLHTGKHPL
jgi:hypothetical protein